MNTINTFKRAYLVFTFTFMIYQGFIIALLNSQGVSESKIGLILSVNMISAVLGQFLNGYLSDKFLSPRQVMLIQIFLSMLGISLLFFSTSYVVFIIIAMIMGFSIQSIYSTIDSWVLFESKETHDNYASILIFSSLGKSISTIFVGKLFEILGYSYMPLFYVISASILLIDIYKMGNSESREDKKLDFSDLKGLLSVKFFLNILLVSFIVFGMYTVFVNSNILIQNYGGTVFHIGIFIALAGVSEMIYYSIINKYMNKVHPYGYLLIATLLLLVDIFIILFTNDYIYIILSGLIYSGIFVNFLMGAKKLFVIICDENVKNLGQSISSALYFSLAAAITTSVTGILAENIGIKPMFRYVLIEVGIVLIVLFFLNKKLRLIKIKK